MNIDVCVKNALDKKLNVYFIATADKQTHVDVRAVVPANPGCNCYSVAKAYTALGVGICYDRGLLALDTTVGKVLGKYFTPAVDEKWRDVTVDRLLRHRSGVKDCLLDIDVLDASKFDTTDYLQIVLSQEIADASGEYFRYTDDVYYLLSRIICEASGQNLTDLLRRHGDDEIQGTRLERLPSWLCVGRHGIVPAHRGYGQIGCIVSSRRRLERHSRSFRGMGAALR